MTLLTQVFSLLVSALATIVLSVCLAFLALRVAPYDAITTQLRESGVSQSTIDTRRQQLGLDDPIGTQLLAYLSGVFRGDLGVSLVSGQSVNELVLGNLRPTLELAGASLGIGIVVGIAVGSLGGIAQWDGVKAGVGRWASSPLRTWRTFFVALALSIPSYWLGTLMIWVFAVQLDWFPASGVGGFEHLALPALTLGIGLSGSIAAMTAATIRDISHREFVLAAYGKGLTVQAVHMTHVLRAAAPALAAFISNQAVFLLGGTVVTESVFSRPGLGRLLVDAALRQDFPVVQGLVVWSSIVVVCLRLISWSVDQVLDPRLRQL